VVYYWTTVIEYLYKSVMIAETFIFNIFKELYIWALFRVDWIK